MSATEGPPDLLDLIRCLPPEALRQALTHSSWVEERTDSYERLEFLGDSVLGLAAAAHLYERFPDLDEGGLAKLKAFAVSRRSCALVAQRLNVGELVTEYGPADESERRLLLDSPALLGNVLEALIGGCYLEHGFDVTRDAVVEAFAGQVSYGLTHLVDHKSALQEHLAAQSRHASYRVVDEEGPPHDRLFTSQVFVGGRLLGTGRGTSIKQSEQAAAREALEQLGIVSSEPESSEGDPGAGPRGGG